jgi:hypothetical protein
MTNYEELNEIKEMPDEFFFEMVGEGWRPLVKLILELLTKKERVIQIKEKFGQLRVYIEPFNIDLSNKIGLLEDLSSYMCEYCGSYAGCCDKTSWFKTHCDKNECALKHNCVGK